MATDTKGIIECVTICRTRFCSPICCGCRLWSSQWELPRIQNSAMFHEENEWKWATQWARKAHFSAPSRFLWPSWIWNKDPLGELHLLTHLTQHLYRRIKKSKGGWQKKKTQSTSKDSVTWWNSQVGWPDVCKVDNTIFNQFYSF